MSTSVLNLASLRQISYKLIPSNLLSFQDEIFLACAALVPDLSNIIYGESVLEDKKALSPFPVLVRPEPDDSFYLASDKDHLKRYSSYGSFDSDNNFTFTNPASYSSALSVYDSKLAKENLLLGQFHAFTMNNISDESKVMMESFSGSDEIWRKANIDVRALWKLIRESHLLKTNNARLSVLKSFLEPVSIGSSIHEYNKAFVLKKTHLESAFEEYKTKTGAEVFNFLTVLLYINGFVEENQLPLTVDRILNKKEKTDECLPLAKIITEFTTEFNNNALSQQKIYGNVATGVNSVPTATTYPCGHKEDVARYDKDMNLQPLCRACFRTRFNKSKEPIPSKASTSISASLPLKKTPNVVKHANLPAPAKKITVSTDRTKKVDDARKAVTFGAVCDHYNLSFEDAAVILSKGQNPYDEGM